MSTFVVVAAAVLLTACSGPSPSVVRIGVFEPLTGAYAQGGSEELAGIVLAHDEAPTVTLGGASLPVELVVVDNGSDDAKAAETARGLVADGSIHLVIGSWGAGLSLAAAPVFDEAGIPAIGPSFTNPLVTGGRRSYFRLAPSDADIGAVMAAFAARELGATGAATLREVSSEASRALAGSFAESFRRLSGKPGSLAPELGYNAGDLDFSAQLAMVRVAAPGAVFLAGTTADAARIIAQARAAGMAPVFLGTASMDASRLATLAGEAAEGTCFPAAYDPATVPTRRAASFAASFAAANGRRPTAAAALAYDAYLIALDAIARAGGLDAAGIRDALSATADFEGAAGRVSFDGGTDPVREVVVLEMRDGAPVVRAVVSP